ncbi:MAG TPA: winged helix-turn-helix domain-containing protein [Acidobacteriaceae bacterium]|jgi:Tol biopolymer transport system component/DNA-binding winged helix-turn-helix (wHTH) protein|nr:winged helix-turn-helix domain-containing protein [Acidobacteriaceae bacterium]
MAIEIKREGLRRAQFGLFEADLEAEELRRSGIRVRLQSQPFKLLASLLQHSGEVVARETLQQELWGADTTVDFDHGLGIAVNKLREALGDSAENPRYVETLARRGYRFIAPVKVLDPPPADSAAATVTAPPPARHFAGSPWVAGALVLLCLILIWTLVLLPPIHAPYRVAQITFSGHVLINDLDVESFSSSASDGTRIYFSDMNNGSPALAVALTANGEMSHFNLPSEIGAPLIGSLSPDGSRLALRSHLQAEPEQPLWIVPTLGGDARRVGNVLAHDVTWMPDGQHLLVASGNQLVEMGADGANPSSLLTTPGRAFWLRWSPDGTHLRFTLRNPNRQTSELWEVNADGSHLHPLLPGWSQPASECCGSWTPDGDDYVFQSSHSGHSEIWVLREKPWYRAGGGPRQITNGPLEYEAPSTAPGGDRVYFIGATAQFDLLRAMPGSTSFVSLDENLSAAAMAEYSPDGKWVAWLNEADNSLWRSRVNGNERIELTTSPLRIFNMRWSPDDRSLAVMAEEPGKPWKIYLIDAEGGKITPILNEDRNEADPSWSPDGHSIVFGRPPDRMDSRQPKAIYLLDLATKNVTGIPGSTGLFSPRLSPDGRYLLAMPLDQHALLLFDRTTGRWSTLATHGVGDPTWSHDGRYVYFQDFLEADKPIYRVAVPVGKLEKIATLDNLRPTAATDYRLIGLAPGDLPIVTVRTPAVNLYEVDLRER